MKINAFPSILSPKNFTISATFFMCTFIDILLYMHIFMIYVFRLSRHNSHVVVGGESSNAENRRMDVLFPEFSPMMWGMTSFCKFHARKKTMKLGEYWSTCILYDSSYGGQFLRFKIQRLYNVFWRTMISLN